MDELPLTIPEGSPLRARRHLVIGEYRAHIGERVLKYVRRSEVREVRAVRRKLKLTKDRIGVRRHITLEEDFDHRGDEWRWRDGCGIGCRRRIGYGGAERDRRRKCNGRTQGNAGRQRDRRRGRKIPVCDRLPISVQDTGKAQKQ